MNVTNKSELTLTNEINLGLLIATILLALIALANLIVVTRTWKSKKEYMEKDAEWQKELLDKKQKNIKINILMEKAKLRLEESNSLLNESNKIHLELFKKGIDPNLPSLFSGQRDSKSESLITRYKSLKDESRIKKRNYNAYIKKINILIDED